MLAKSARIMLRTNLWIKADLVNSSVGTIQEIIFKENQSPPSLLIAILIEFDNYFNPAIITEDKRLVLISLIKYSWKEKRETCSCLQVFIYLAWIITIHKSQELILQKIMLDLEKNKFTTKLLFVAISWVCALWNTLFRSSFYLKDCNVSKLARDFKRERLKKNI